MSIIIKTAGIFLYLMVVNFTTTNAQTFSQKRETYFNSERIKYQKEIKFAEKHSSLIMSNLGEINANQFFTDIIFDSTGLEEMLGQMRSKCEYIKWFGGYMGYFLEDNIDTKKKMVHCLYEYELNCGHYLFQFSYILENEAAKLWFFRRKNGNTPLDMLPNLILDS